MIAYTIEAALKSKYIDKLVVSTEDAEIAGISRKYGAEVIDRPKELATDAAATMPVLKHAVDQLSKGGYNAGAVVLLQPTSPLRETSDIDAAVEKFLSTGADLVVTAVEVKNHPFWSFELDGGKIKPFVNDGFSRTQRQTLPKLYTVNGAVYVMNMKALERGSIYGGDMRAVVMESERSADIDTLPEFEDAESFILRKRAERATKKVRIADKNVGEGERCFIIAEAGVNHNGDIDTAKKLVDAAKAAGADAVKFQTFKVEDLVNKSADTANYQKKNIGKPQSQFEMLKSLELGYEQFKELKEYCDRKGIIFMSTPHTEDAADFLEKLVPAYKIGSGDLTNIPFLGRLAAKMKPIILSTGMANMDETQEAVDAIYSADNKDLIVLHCTTDYPCKPEDVNLKAMQNIHKMLGCMVGYSDHTAGIEVPVAAVAMGAVVIEKHFTLDKNMPGPDHKASLTPAEFKQMIEKIRIVEDALGSGTKMPTEAELGVMPIIRKSVIAATDIKPGTALKREMLTVKRPANGIEPKYVDKIIGMKAKCDIRKDEPITWDKLE